MKLWSKALLGLVAGVIFGIFFPGITHYIKPVGDIFIQFIKMLVIPLVSSTVIVGVTGINDPKRLGRVGIKTISLYLISASFAVAIGLFMGKIFHPGLGIVLGEVTLSSPIEPRSALETVLGIIPSNPVEAMVKQNVLQVIVFSLLLGIGLSFGGRKTQPVIRFFEGLAEGMYRLTAIIMEIAPYGVFALIAYVSSTYGLAMLLPLGKVLLGIYLGSIIHMVLVLGVCVFMFGRLNPIRFFRAIADAIVFAFSTASSAGTLPITLRCVRKNLGISKKIASFTIPLGATINMDGTAIYQGVAALFVAQAYGIDLSIGNYATIIVASTIASIGTAGIPGAGLIVLALVLNSVGLPIEGIAIIAGIDRVLDMVRTTTNVVGDCAITYLVARSEGEVKIKG